MKNLSTHDTVIDEADIEEQLKKAYIDGALYSLRAFRPKYVVTDHSISEEAQQYVAGLNKENS